MIDEKLISICIPTYNGAATIIKTLDSIRYSINSLATGFSNLEIVLTDDNSTDQTVALIEEYATPYDFIKIFKNENNLGMDRNFRQVALNARGRYVWFSGQDDIFLPEAIPHVLQSLRKKPYLKIISVNFSQYQENNGACLCSSMLHRQAYQPGNLDFSKDLEFLGAQEYFKVFNDAPTFLPATIMRRDFWLNTDVTPYYGFCYVQYATLLLNLKNSPILVISRPLIKGLIPNQGWQKNGHKLFSIQLGALKTAALIYRDERNPFPADIFYNKKVNFFKKFPRILLAARYYNLRVSSDNRRELWSLYGSFIYNFYFSPLILISRLLPRVFLKFLMFLSNSQKKYKK